MAIEEANIKSFCQNYNLKSLIKQATCYKNPNKHTCIDLILTNVPRMLQSTCVETGLSDLRLITVAVMRKTFKKISPRVISYRAYRNFFNETFRVSLIKICQKKFLLTTMKDWKNFAKQPWIL